MTYIGYQKMTNTINSHLGGNIIEGDPKTYAPNVWNYVINRFAVKSVLDLGCGIGYAANYFFDKGMKVVGIDGMDENIARAIYPVVQCDLTQGFVTCKVDLVHCQEVVEHVEEQFIENTLRSLTCGKIILLTNGLPGQKGFHHVNNQPTEYWVEHLKRYNCHVLLEDTKRIRKIAENEGAIYLARTGTLYANRDKF
ncbi:MAG: methyltransferase domain-containing protein [Mucilaginibacter sp.]|uniref:class I SAM-dependent methyltransferase n=1 Tax=Mucilaginibacter sp. TaxID=1882438 RepID=UPI0032676854